MDLAGRTALVTGASAGIGRATALALTQRGVRVKATGLEAEPLVELARSHGVAVLAADLGRADDLDEVWRWAGAVDLLVNVAGFGRYEALAAIDCDATLELLAVNLAAPIRLTAALAPGMVARGDGHIVNVASIAGYVGVAHEAVYSASKAGLIAFWRACATSWPAAGSASPSSCPPSWRHGSSTSAAGRTRGAFRGRWPPRASPPRSWPGSNATPLRSSCRAGRGAARLRGAAPRLFRRAAGRAMREPDARRYPGWPSWPAISTGKSLVRYWPGGSRPAAPRCALVPGTPWR